jgi:deazaflavin-dependent oxidoreductase (nitroreductase family)
MPIPDGMRRVNKIALNRLTRPLCRWLPGMGVVLHRGRRSGRTYQTPVNVFPRPGGRFIVALTYGQDTDWLKNVLAAGGCQLLSGGRRIDLSAPRVFHDESRHEIRVVERRLLGLLDVNDFLELHIVCP